MCLTVGDDSFAIIWDMLLGELRFKLVGHSAAIKSGKLFGRSPG